MEYSPSISNVSPTDARFDVGVGAVRSSSFPSWAWTSAAVLVSLLVLEQSVYRLKKKGLPGDKWLIPVIGKFADSMNPTLQNYERQWNLGALSCVSVFNMCGVQVHCATCTSYSHN